MLRNSALIPLSHQHHNGLALCVLTRRSLAADSSAGNIARLARRIVDTYDIELTNHFAMEEEDLFPAAGRCCGSLPLIAELIAEHRQIEQRVAVLRDAPARDLLEPFCDLLTTHIRREESELFPMIQERMAVDDLAAVGRTLAARAVQVCITFDKSLA